MFRLTREVRFAVNHRPDDQLARGAASNGFGGFPALTDVGHFFAVRVGLSGEVDRSAYLVNIKNIDVAVRERVIPVVEKYVRDNLRQGGPAGLTDSIFDQLHGGWGQARLDTVELALSPYLSVACHASERPMTRLSQKFEFSASHRLFSPALSEEQNRQTYGKCSNPHGHGHNYELQVTIAGTAGAGGVLMEVPALERVVNETVIARFDHKNLNVECAEFKDVIPSVENIARVIYGLLKPRVANERTRLASVTVWETPKTWCEYSEA
jgi:6-pyruvoyltetrahydropterin/6-carboxytetrahydropterin synthase